MKKREITKNQLSLCSSMNYMSNFSKNAKKELLKTCFLYFAYDFALDSEINVRKLYNFKFEECKRIDSKIDLLADGWKAYVTLDDEFIDLLLDIIRFDLKDEPFYEVTFKRYFK